MSSRLRNQTTFQILSVVFFSFIAYLTVGIPLAVVPSFVQGLGYGPIVAGLAISVQYLATFLSRAPAGRMSDRRGPKRTVLVGLLVCGASGILTLLAGLTVKMPALCLALLLAGRLVLGCGESFVATTAILWGIGRIGAEHTARVISWNGVATYTAIAVGAPLGIFLNDHFGFASIGASVLLLAWFSFPIALRQPATATIPGKPIPIHQIFGRTLPYGLGLALGGAGFGALATFITLYYQAHGWAHAAFALTAFGTFFVAVRLFFASSINRVGGYRVALVSLTIEVVGLLVLWWAPAVAYAFVGATLTGIGFSLVFPALGVESVARVTPDNRGAALAVYSVFVDVSLGITGPVGGFIASRQGFPAIFLYAAGASFVAVLLVATLFSLQGKKLALTPKLSS